MEKSSSDAKSRNSEQVKLSKIERVVESLEYKKERLQDLTGIEDEQKLFNVYNDLVALFTQIGLENISYRKNTVTDRNVTETELALRNLNGEELIGLEETLRELRIFGFPEPVADTNYTDLIIENKRDLEVLRLMPVFKNIDTMHEEEKFAVQKHELQEGRVEEKRRMGTIVDAAFAAIQPQDIDLGFEIESLKDPFEEVTKFRGFQPKPPRGKIIRRSEAHLSEQKEFENEVDPIELDEKMAYYAQLWGSGEIADLDEEPIHLKGSKVDLGIFPKRFIWKADKETGRKKCFEFDVNTKQVGREVSKQERDVYISDLGHARHARFVQEKALDKQLSKSKEEVALEQKVILTLNNLIVWLINDLTLSMRGNIELHRIKENDVDDLYQNAVLGLLYAIDHHNPEKALSGNPLSYIMACMEGYVRRTGRTEYGMALQKEQIRIPPHLHDVRRKIQKTERLVRSHYPGESDNQKIDTLLAVVLSSPEVGVLPIGSGVPDLLALREKLLLDYEEVAYDILDSEELDVDAQMSALAELLYTEPTQEASEERRRLQEAVSYALSTLTPREERVLQLRFFSQSFDQEKSMSSDRDGQTLDEIGDHLHISTERVRQIEAKALRKLRHPARSKTLRKFLG